MDKYIVEYSQTEIKHDNKNELSITTFNNMDKSHIYNVNERR